MNKLCLKIVQTALTWPLQYANFQNFSGGAFPRTPLESFCYLSCLELTLPGKTALEKSDEIWCPLPEKKSQCAPDMKHFQRAYLRPFPRLNVFLTFNLIQSYIPPTKTFWIRSWWQGQSRQLSACVTQHEEMSQQLVTLCQI